MPQYDFDLFTIGAGSGGVRASRLAAGRGKRVAIAEESRVGGTCVLRGCVPKKLLVIGSHFAEDFADALEDSRATVTEEMEEEYGRMKGELKKRAMEVTPIGFIAPGMVESTRQRKT